MTLLKDCSNLKRTNTSNKIERPILIITGATATGKTKTSIQLAKNLFKEKQIPAIIINFDSLLFYKELNIGTAKPTSEEMQDITHFLIDIVSITQEFNAAEFCRQAKKIINKYIKSHYIILVGGSPFYIRALVKGMYDNSENIYPQNANEHGKGNKNKSINIDDINLFLKQYDPKSLQLFHQNDHYRRERAYFYFKRTGIAYSKAKMEQEKNLPYDFSVNTKLDAPIKTIYLEIEKNSHWNIIKERTINMINSGLLQEVNLLLERGFSSDLKALKSIGYIQTTLLLQKYNCDLNKISNKDKDQLIESIFIATRQLAKSQKTFFKKINPKITLNPLDLNICNFIKHHL